MTRLIPLMILCFLFLGACGVGESSDHPSRPARNLPAHAILNRQNPAEEASGPLRVLVMGHLYGRPGLNRERPSPSFVHALPRLIALKPDLCVLLGDTFYRWRQDEVKRTTELLNRFPCPVINAVGNHDVVKRKEYEERFGPTWYAFTLKGSRFVITDTELDSWHISDDQLAMVKTELEACHSDHPPNNLFFFSHKVLWAGTQETAVAAIGCNDPASMSVFGTRPPERPTFNRDIRPFLRDAAQKVPIYWFAGDVGAFPKSVDTFFQKDTRLPGTSLFYLTTGLGNLPRDSALVIDIDTSGHAGVRGYRLRDMSFVPLQGLGSQHWNPKILPGGKIPSKMLPYLEQ